MSKHARIAHLTWLMAPIQKSIDSAKVHLDAYIKKCSDLDKAPSDAQPVWFTNQMTMRDEALSRLKYEVSLIHSALVIAECVGGASLAHEIKIVLSNIQNSIHATGREEDALVSVVNGLLAIPKYVSMIIDGAPDTAVILAKHINELREIRGVQLIEEDNVLPPGVEFEFIEPPRKKPNCPLELRNKTFAAAPKLFYGAFSTFMSNGSRVALDEMKNVLRQLQEVTYDREVGCFWWMGECLINSIICGAIRNGGNTLSQIRTLSVAIQKAASGGEEAAKATLGIVRFKSLLGVLSMSSRLPDDVEMALAAFNVSPAADQSQVDDLQRRLDESKVDSLTDVVAELKPLLETSMVSLGRAIGSKNQAGFDAQINKFRSTLRQVASVFYMVGEDNLAAVATQVLKSVDHVSGAASFSSTELLDKLKTDFVFLDQRIRNLDANEAARSLGLTEVSLDVVEAVVSQAVCELTVVRRLITQHMDSGTGSEDLLGGLERLRTTANALSFTGLETVGQVLNGSCQGFITLLKGGAIKPSPGADLAARALVAVETYLAAVGERLTPSPILLQRAEEGLAELGIHIEHIEQVSESELITVFDAQTAVQADSDPFLSEMFEVRAALELSVKSPDVCNRAVMGHLYRIADRLSVAANLYSYEYFSQLARALAVAANHLQEKELGDEANVQMARSSIRAGIEMALRCMDEYAAKGTVSLYTKEVAASLLNLVDGHSAAIPSEPNEPGTDPVEEAVQAVTVLEPNTVLVEPENELREYPEGVDGVLMEIFREEFALSHAVLTAFCKTAGGRITKEIRRAAHSIYGNSANARCEPLRRVYGALEERLDNLFAQDVLLSGEDILQLETVLSESSDFLADFPWSMETQLVDLWLEAIEELGYVQPQQPDPEPQAAADISHAECQVAPAPEPEQAPEPAPELLQATAEPLAGPTAAPDEPALGREYNEEFEFYLEEADDVLPELQSNVASWLGDMSNRGLIIEIKRQMHTLKGAALMAEAESIGAITHSMESLFESLSINLITPDEDCAQLVSIALDSIGGMTALMKQQQPYPKPTQLMACLEFAIDNNAINLSMLMATQPGQAKVGEAAAESVMIAPELVETEDSVQIEEEIIETKEPEPTVGIRIEHIEPAAEAAATQEAPEEQQPVQRKRVRRGGRGKGPAKRHAEQRGDLSSTVGEEVQATAVPKLAEISTLEASDSLEKISHAECESESSETRLQRYRDEEIALFDRLYTLSETDEKAASPLVSQHVKKILAKDEVTRAASKKGTLVNGEKIKVDLKLLETASELSSELGAIRHRLSGLNEDLLLRLSTVRDRLDNNSLQHGQFTTALRGFLNAQPVSRGQADEGMERFNELSALFVTLVAQYEDMREEFLETIDIAKLMKVAIQDQALITNSLQRDLLDSRLIPFTIVKPKLQGAVRQANAATRKNVSITIVGDEAIMDRMILDSIAEPLTHVLRNAVDHGIEDSSERVAAGKPENGSIAISVIRRAKNVLISISDDGRGINVEAVKAKAIEQGVISENDILTDKEALRLITRNGFSTAAKTTSLSGRGVGMDIVASSIDALGGQLFIDSQVGIGTTFTVELPFTIGANKAMMVSSGSQWFAIQSYLITQITMVSSAALDLQRETNGYAVVEHENQEFEVIHLADLIAMPDSRGNSLACKDVTLILCEHGDTRIAVEVPLVDSMPEIHIRKLEGVLSQVRGIVGETEMQDGTVVFVLDVIELARLNLKRGPQGYQVRQNRIKSMKRDQKPIVMVIDDSRTYRSLLERMFTGMGYIVVTAIDGLDALDKLPMDRGPDLFVVDVEMPRRTGFEFTAQIRANPTYKHVPIIMITTKHEFEARAKAAGVDVFLKKPFDLPAMERAVGSVTAMNKIETAV